jgi:hypothetical protein
MTIVASMISEGEHETTEVVDTTIQPQFHPERSQVATVRGMTNAPMAEA